MMVQACNKKAKIARVCACNIYMAHIIYMQIYAPHRDFCLYTGLLNTWLLHSMVKVSCESPPFKPCSQTTLKKKFLRQLQLHLFSTETLKSRKNPGPPWFGHYLVYVHFASPFAKIF